MPHLTLDYSANLSGQLDFNELCASLRDAMVETGVFPLGGVRVRAIACEHYAIADGDPAYSYIHLTCRMGAGRDETTRKAAAEAIYAAAESFIKPKIMTPFALSLELAELDPATSIKRCNTIHDHIKAKV